jgi:hypothetical protein
MSGDQYLEAILTREAVDTGPYSPIRSVQQKLAPIIQEWAGDRFISISPSGSFAKNTANLTGTDIDLFISLSELTSETLKEIHDKLFNRMREKGFAAKRQNVSINVRVGTVSVDLVPGKRQYNFGDEHSLYRRRADTWTKTNVAKHISHVLQSGRAREIRIVKLWRDQKRLDFPSFYLELTAIAALAGQRSAILSDNVWKIFQYLRDSFALARVVDPANTNNVISEDLTASEKSLIKNAAAQALLAKHWTEIVK